MKGFQKPNPITGPKGNKVAGPNNPFKGNATAAGGGGGGGGGKKKNNNNGGGGKNKNNKGNKGKKGKGQTDESPYTQDSTSIQDANQPGLISTIATEKPLDYFSGQLAGQGQLTGMGPNVYENWLQNQFFNDVYSNYMTAKVNSPYDTSFDTYLTGKYGPGGLAGAAQRQFNLLTPSQRGDFNNVYNNATGRTQFWG